MHDGPGYRNFLCFSPGHRKHETDSRSADVAASPPSVTPVTAPAPLPRCGVNGHGLLQVQAFSFRGCGHTYCVDLDVINPGGLHRETLGGPLPFPWSPPVCLLHAARPKGTTPTHAPRDFRQSCILFRLSPLGSRDRTKLRRARPDTWEKFGFAPRLYLGCRHRCAKSTPRLSGCRRRSAVWTLQKVPTKVRG